MTPSPGGEVVVYEAPDGSAQVTVRLERDTVWLSLMQMAELFWRDKSVISRHLRNVFERGELERAATVAKNATVQALALLVAESAPASKDVMIRLIVNLLTEPPG